MKPIAFIPHKQRVEKYKVEYLKAIANAMDNPWQAEDGRDLAPVQAALTNKCVKLSNIPLWTFTNCCTDSLQIAVQALTKPEDLVLVPAYGWRGFVNAMVFMNRKIEFLDVDMSGNIDVEKAIKRIKNNPKPAALVMVHNFGTITNVKELCDLCRELDIKTIEDAAPSFIVDEQNMVSYVPGSASDVVCYSFDFTKNPGTLGSGGAIATRYSDIHNTIYQIQAHGINKNKEVVRVGTKSYLDNTSCAVLLKEIELFETYNLRQKRRDVAAWYSNNLRFKHIIGENYIWERYSIRISKNLVEDVLEALHEVKCLARTMFKQPLNTMSHFNSNLNLPGVVEFTENLIHLPCHHFLSSEDLERISSKIG